MNPTRLRRAARFTDSMTSSSQAVLLHTGYRTAGTWLWSCFRRLDNVTAYYEPLHEMLATIDPATLASSTADSWHSGHPSLDAPYFAEFAHLLEPGARGIPGYERRFAIDRFDGQTPEGADRLAGYLRGLMRAAHEQGRVPVLKFCRSLGRLQWFRAAFPDAVHVVVEKNPISQWQSCWELFAAHRNPHFVAVPFAVLALNRHVPIVQQTMDALQIDLPPRPDGSTGSTSSTSSMASVGPTGLHVPTFEASIAFYKAHIATLAPLQAYRAFLAHWLLTLRDAATHADAIFDCDLAGRSPAYVEGAERWLGDLTGLSPSLRSARREETAERGCGFDALEGLQVHLEALRWGRELATNGSIEADALSLWTSKLAQATQVMAFGTAANWPQARVPAGRATRVVDVALIDGAGIDAVLTCELAAARAALHDVKTQLAQVQNSPLWRLMAPVRKLRLRAAKRWRRDRGAVKPRISAAQ